VQLNNEYINGRCEKWSTFSSLVV